MNPARYILRLGAPLLLLAVANAQAAESAPEPAIWSLPAATEVHQAMQQSPLLQVAVESVAQGRARQSLLRAGPHELEVSALAQRRTNEFGQTGNEQEYGLQTGVRWPWKRALDLQIGSFAREVGELSYLDAWHEAGRALLDHWYAWLHAEYTARLHDQHLEVLQGQQEAVARRVTAGDAARIELQLAESETLRLRAARIQAQRDARLAQEVLVREFPLLPLQLPAALQTPATLPESDTDLLKQIIEENHEIELAAARREEAMLSSERAARDRLADPSIGVRYTNNLGGERKVIGLTFSMPIGGAARTAQAALARSNAREAAAGALRTQDSVSAAARSAVADARHSLSSWQEAQAAQQQVQSVAAATAQGYSLGEFDISVLLAARRAALLAEQELLDALVRAEWSHARVLLDAHRLWAPPGHEGE
jgi:cobalt-zinc-cadmium efflux system outer membrane protein